MRKAVLAGAILAALLTGCGHKPPIEQNDYNRFKIVAIYKDGREIVDTDTGNAYFEFFYRQGAVPLFDEYGNTYKPNGWRDYGE